MTKQLYLIDSYMKDCEARVTNADGNNVVLDQTIFYAVGGGQPCDVGVIKNGNAEFKVVSVRKNAEDILHEVDKEGLKVGDKVHCTIDWSRRYKLMRSHTSAHIVSGVFHQQTGAKITGNQLEGDKVRIDFELEEFDKDKIESYVDNANEIISKNIPVAITLMSREKVEQDQNLSKLAKGLPPRIMELRIVDINGFDKQPCGGTHINNTSEIDQLRLIKCENKGKNNRRVYYELVS